MSPRILAIIAVLIVVILALILIFTYQPPKEVLKQMGELKLASPAFQDGGNIPDKYTCQGEDVNPPLEIENIPEGTKSLVLIMDDPDAPAGTWDHWVMWNIPVTSRIAENSVPEGAVQGKNSWGRSSYSGPCPPSGIHRYIFKLYALDATLNLDSSSGKGEVEAAMEGHILAQTSLTGLYSKG
jgi:hypothetical protein